MQGIRAGEVGAGVGEEGPAGGGGGGGQQAATGRAAQISIPDRPAGEIYRTGELKRPCTQEKESPVNRLSVILFGAVPILPAPALPGCGTGVSSSVPPPQQLGNPSAGHKRASAGRRLCRAQCYRGQCPPRCPPPRDGDFEAGSPPPPSPGTNCAMATLTVGWAVPGGGPLLQTP